MLEYLHEGLVIHSKYFYTLQRGKRVYHEEEPKKEKTYFTFEGFMYPPLFLLNNTWSRYKYTKEDILLTYDKMEASYVMGFGPYLFGWCL